MLPANCCAGLLTFDGKGEQMTKRAILALVDPSEASEGSAAAALAFAGPFGADVTVGLVAAVPVPGDRTFPPHLSKQQFNELLEKKEQQTWSLAHASGCEVRIFIDPVDASLDAIVRAARCFDLILLGPVTAFDRDLRLMLIEKLLLHAGKPLVLMTGQGPAHRPARVVVGWDGGTEASIALDRALEWTDTHARFDLISVLPMNSPLSLRSEADDMCGRLTRRGHAAVSSIARRGHLSTAATLLGRAVAESADLVVVGGFGHSRLREALVGGVTSEIIRGEHTLPVLIAH